jgi:Nucleoside-diphosphate-sugar epimerases
MKILVTGGNGFVARNLKKLLENVGHDVLAPNRLELDICNLQTLKSYVNLHRPEAIIHAASKGGYRNVPDTYNDFTSNMVMFENIMKVVEDRKLILFTSGADMDRRYSIHNVREINMFNSWPIDLYGLSKNLNVRKLDDIHHYNIDSYYVRLFGCFNEDEIDARFIKRSILNIKEGLPIRIIQNRQMDFFYMDDLFTLIERLLVMEIYTPNSINGINAVYKEKTTLLDIANIICKYTSHLNPKIIVETPDIGMSYSGDGYYMETLNLPLVGLETGIRRTINKLL